MIGRITFLNENTFIFIQKEDVSKLKYWQLFMNMIFIMINLDSGHPVAIITKIVRLVRVIIRLIVPALNSPYEDSLSTI